MPVRGLGEIRLPLFGVVETGRLWLAAGIAAAVVLIIGLIAFAIWRTAFGPPPPELDRSEKLPGQYFEHLGRLHLQPGQVFTEYNSNPPTSGPHDPRAPQFRIYNDPVPKETVVHAMEHGGVIIWYNCTDCQDTVDQLKEIAREYLRKNKNVLMTPYPEMEPNTIALTAWTRLDKFSVPDFTPERVKRFIDAHHCRYRPEPNTCQR